MKKENETFSYKLSNWLNISSNSDSKSNSNHFETTNSPSKNNSPVESMF